MSKTKVKGRILARFWSQPSSRDHKFLPSLIFSKTKKEEKIQRNKELQQEKK